MWGMAGFRRNRGTCAAGSVTDPLPFRITYAAQRGWPSGLHPPLCAFHADVLYLPLGRLLIRL
jgi:hypothetical protein